MRERILKYIKQFGSITTFQAFIDLGCTRLSEYIRQLRLDYDIEDEWIEVVTRFGITTHVKKYFLKEEGK